MTIDQVYERLYEEKTNADLSSSRFPFRVIMVKNIARYCELLKKLIQLPNVNVVPSNELFSGNDIMPRYENLKRSQYDSKWVVLAGVSEYLRLFGRNEAITQRLKKLLSYRAPASSVGRIIIPLWDCEALWFDSTVHLMDDERLRDYYYECIDETDYEQKLTVNVFSDQFRQYKTQLTGSDTLVFGNLKEWYEYWTDPKPDLTEYVLITARTHLMYPINGAVSIHIVNDKFSYLKENLSDGQLLTVENCSIDAQNVLFTEITENSSVDTVILSCLNVGAFSSMDIMGKWNTLERGRKDLIRLWYSLHPDNTYLCHCVVCANDITEIENLILHEIIHMSNVPSKWIVESRDLVSVMKLERDDEYFRVLDSIPEYDKRLNYLSGTSSKEKVYILKTVGGWLNQNKINVYQNDKLKAIYPELCGYLSNEGYDDELAKYFESYKIYKLSNTLPTDEEMHFLGIKTESYDYRYTLLSSKLTDQTVVLWIDALGAEWLPLLVTMLKARKDGKVIYSFIGQANLPTETKYNMQWESMEVPYMKLNYLDKLAHKGLSYKDIDDYYSCIEEQITFITKTISSKITELLGKYQRIIITGDHGTSRLAARFFHKKDGVPVSKNTKVFSHGRYGQINTEPLVMMQTQKLVSDDIGQQYIVFTNYDHFVKSGFAAGVDDDNVVYGEVHGGATPEEMLVPIIVYDSSKSIPLEAEWENRIVKICRRKVRAVVKFNRPVQSVQAKIKTLTASVTHSVDFKKWILEFNGISDDAYNVDIVADGKMILIEKIIVKSALGSGDGDLP